MCTVRVFAAAENFAAADMELFAAVTRRQRGELVGGDEGATLVAEADGWMTEQTIQRPERMAGVLAPGFED